MDWRDAVLVAARQAPWIDAQDVYQATVPEVWITTAHYVINRTSAATSYVTFDDL